MVIEVKGLRWLLIYSGLGVIRRSGLFLGWKCSAKCYSAIRNKNMVCERGIFMNEVYFNRGSNINIMMHHLIPPSKHIQIHVCAMHTVKQLTK